MFKFDSWYSKRPQANYEFVELTALVIFHHEWKAIHECLSGFRKFYPDGKVLLARDGLDPVIPKILEEFSPSCLKTFSPMQELVELNWNLQSIEDLTIEKLERIFDMQIQRMFHAAMASDTEFLLALEWDATVRGRVPVNRNIDLEILEVNPLTQEFKLDLEIMSGRKVEFDGWGFVVGTIRRDAILEAENWLRENRVTLVQFLAKWPKIVYLDLLIPVLFHFAGLKIGNSGFTTECKRDRFWRFRRSPLLHQVSRKNQSHRDLAALTQKSGHY